MLPSLQWHTELVHAGVHQIWWLVHICWNRGLKGRQISGGVKNVGTFLSGVHKYAVVGAAEIWQAACPRSGVLKAVGSVFRRQKMLQASLTLTHIAFVWV
jgi:hypothetical protein